MGRAVGEGHALLLRREGARGNPRGMATRHLDEYTDNATSPRIRGIPRLRLRNSPVLSRFPIWIAPESTRRQAILFSIPMTLQARSRPFAPMGVTTRALRATADEFAGGWAEDGGEQLKRMPRRRFTAARRLPPASPRSHHRGPDHLRGVGAWR